MTAWNETLPALILSKKKVVLATHINPDGDALGSLLGFADILEQMGKEVLRYLEEPIIHLYHFLPGYELVETDLDKVTAWAKDAGDDVIGICLDCGDMKRLGKSGPQLVDIHPFVVIDHHKGNDGFGDLAWIEPHRSSTGEMIFDLAVEMGETLSPAAADCLYTAIVTDTGSFHYASTSSHTFAVAGELLACGVNPAAIAGSLYENYSPGRLRLMQLVLATLEMVFDDRVAIIRVSADMLAATGTSMEETDNFINLPRAVRPVQVAIFLKENDTDQVSVSLRAKGCCDVSAVAAHFGGGGHHSASGFRMNNHSLDEVRDMLLPVLKQELDT